MANLGDLKTRIITEVNRDDLLDDLAQSLQICIDRSIDFYANQKLKFNELRVEGETIPNSQYVPLPVGTRILDQIFLLIGGVRYDLIKRSMEYIEGLYSTPLGGQPTDYCVFDGLVRLWPEPQQAYFLVWLTVTDEAPLIVDTDENAWTNTGQDVIVGRSKLYLYRDFFRDPEGAQAAQQQLDEALSRLKAESNRLIGTGRITCSW